MLNSLLLTCALQAALIVFGRHGPWKVNTGPPITVLDDNDYLRPMSYLDTMALDTARVRLFMNSHG